MITFYRPGRNTAKQGILPTNAEGNNAYSLTGFMAANESAGAARRAYLPSEFKTATEPVPVQKGAKAKATLPGYEFTEVVKSMFGRIPSIRKVS